MLPCQHDPAETVSHSLWFARLLKGRLLFYAQSIPWFDSAWLIRNELKRLISYFYRDPAVSYAQIQFGKTLAPEDVVERLRGDLLSPELCDGVEDFVGLVNTPLGPGQERQRAREVAAGFDAIHTVVALIADDLSSRTAGAKRNRREALSAIVHDSSVTVIPTSHAADRYE